MHIETINPFNGEQINKYRIFDQNEIDVKISRADLAYREWRNVPVATRCEALRRVSSILRDSQNELALLITSEMGKVEDEARKEIEKCASVCDYYADNAESFLADELIESSAEKSFVSFEPLGAVLAVMPWNFPFWQVFRFAAPAIAAGNACLLKHASNVSGCSIAIEEVFRKANLPSGLFSSLIIKSSQVESVIANAKVKAVTLTGSTQAGKVVAEQAGRHLKKIVVELGGSDPYIILGDANIKTAVSACVASRLLNAGQSCISAKRFIVHKDRCKQFEEQFVAQMRQATYGDPKDPSTTIGPLAKVELQEQLNRQVKESIEKGAVLLCGGEVPEQSGNFYPPTVLSQVPRDCPAYDEELFGPVASIIYANDDEDALSIANDTHFGLGAAVFSENIPYATSIARRIEAGSVTINGFVTSDPCLPFGGTKESGFGRELSHYGIKEFVNIKSIVISNP